MTWNLVSDSSCDLRASSFHSGSVRFTSVPLHIQVGEQTFVDDDSLSVPAMLSAMAAEKAAFSAVLAPPPPLGRGPTAGDGPRRPRRSVGVMPAEHQGA